MNPETIRYLTREEIRALLRAAGKSKRDRAIFLVAYTYGLRASEVGLLYREDVDFNRARIHIHSLKNSLLGEYPLRPEVARALKAYLRTRKDASPYLFISQRGLPISRKILHFLMRKYGEAAGIPPEKRHFHVLKHSIATHLLEAGADVIFVRDWLGHKNIQNTLVYSQLTAWARDERVRRVFSRLKIG